MTLGPSLGFCCCPENKEFFHVTVAPRKTTLLGKKGRTAVLLDVQRVASEVTEP